MLFFLTTGQHNWSDRFDAFVANLVFSFISVTTTRELSFTSLGKSNRTPGKRNIISLKRDTFCGHQITGGKPKASGRHRKARAKLKFPLCRLLPIRPTHRAIFAKLPTPFQLQTWCLVICVGWSTKEHCGTNSECTWVSLPWQKFAGGWIKIHSVRPVLRQFDDRLIQQGVSSVRWNVESANICPFSRSQRRPWWPRQFFRER